MNTILVICAAAATIAFVVLVFHAVETLIQVRHTARAVEHLALNADEKLTALDPVLSAAKSVSEGVSSGWLKAARFFYGLFSGR